MKTPHFPRRRIIRRIQRRRAPILAGAATPLMWGWAAGYKVTLTPLPASIRPTPTTALMLKLIKGSLFGPSTKP